MTDPSDPAGLVTRRVRVRGRVQGVGYRDACVDAARALRLAGWVRNRADGAVEVLLQGPPEAIERMLQWLHTGPPLARVDAVDAETLAPADAGALAGFTRRPTA